MRKQIFLMGLACFLFLGSQVSFAQSKQEKKPLVAKTTVQSTELNAEKVIGIFERGSQLNDSQKNKVHSIFEAVEEKRKGIATVEDDKERQRKTALLQNYINTKLMDVLTDQQYKTYLEAMSR